MTKYDLESCLATSNQISELVFKMQNEDCSAQAEWLKHCYHQPNSLTLIPLTPHPVGYISLLSEASYPFFCDQNTPEIHGLFVLPSARGQGVAKFLINEIEQACRDKNYPAVGLGVGITKDYQMALGLYTSLGYKPDGRGLYHASAPDHHVNYGDTIRIDHSTTLWFVKSLG